MSYTSIMIAVAVVFVIIGSMLFAITAYPSFKISFAGLPVKLAGYLLGPLVGAVTGFLTDIISFLFLPTFYFPGYSLTLAITGMIPGIVMWIMIKKPRGINTHFFTTLGMFVFIWIFLFCFFWWLPAKDVDSATSDLVSSKLIYYVIGLSGITSNIIILIILRFSLSSKNFIAIAPIMMFTSISGIVNCFMVPYWDQIMLGIPYLKNLIGHYLLTLPLKLWFNVIIVYVAWKVIHPIIDKNKSDYWK